MLVHVVYKGHSIDNSCNIQNCLSLFIDNNKIQIMTSDTKKLNFCIRTLDSMFAKTLITFLIFIV